jgi:hypothetical protein
VRISRLHRGPYRRQLRQTHQQPQSRDGRRPVSLTQSLARNAILGGALARCARLQLHKHLLGRDRAVLWPRGVARQRATPTASACTNSCQPRTVTATPFHEPRLPCEQNPLPSRPAQPPVSVPTTSFGPQTHRCRRVVPRFDPALKRDVWLRRAEGAANSPTDRPTRATRLRLEDNALQRLGRFRSTGRTVVQLVHDTPTPWSIAQLSRSRSRTCIWICGRHADRSPSIVSGSRLASTISTSPSLLTPMSALALALPDAQGFLASPCPRAPTPRQHRAPLNLAVPQEARRQGVRLNCLRDLRPSILLARPAESPNAIAALALSVAGAVASAVVLGFALRPQARSGLGDGADANVMHYLSDP